MDQHLNVEDEVCEDEKCDDEFRKLFKFYKQRRPCPDLSSVVDFTASWKTEMSVKLSSYQFKSPMDESFPGLYSVDRWKAYTLTDIPGFIFIVNPFKESSRAYWARRCLRDYTQKPNRSNLDAHTSLSEDDNIWQCSLRSPEHRRSLLNKLRWVTLGYHHNWNTKHYSLDDASTMPFDLCALSQYVATAVGYTEYSAEAAIVNFYPPGSTLAGHTDHSEFDRLSPIISFSFGCTAIFLIGGLTKAVTPTAVYVRDGDIIIMSESCRLFYHAVPRVFSSENVSPNHTKHHKKNAISVPDSYQDAKCERLSNNLSRAIENLDDKLDKSVSRDLQLLGNYSILGKHAGGDPIVCDGVTATVLHNNKSCTFTAQGENEEEYQIVDKINNFSSCNKFDSDDPEALSDEILMTVCSNDLDTRVSHEGEPASDWSPVYDYLQSARININVRQVFIR